MGVTSAYFSNLAGMRTYRNEYSDAEVTLEYKITCKRRHVSLRLVHAYKGEEEKKM